MPVKRKILKLLFLFIISLMAVQSCKLLEDESGIDTDKLPLWTISVNEMVKYPRAGSGEEEVPTFDGRKVWVRKHYEINSRSIETITPVELKDNKRYYELKLKLNRHGSLAAMRLSNDISHPKWGLLVDGIFYRTVRLQKTEESEDYTNIIIKGKFDKALAEYLEKYAPVNYKHYHPDSD